MKTALLSLLALLKPPFVRMVSSLKFWTFMLGVATTQAAKYGIEVDPTTYWTLVGFFGLLLGGQAATDLGKEAASRKQAGFARLELQLCMVALLVIGVTSCTWLKSETKQTGSDVVDCTTANVRSLNKQFGPVVEEVIVQATSDDGKVDWSRVKHATRGFAVSTGLCVLANVVARALVPIQKALDAPQSSPLEVDQGELRSGWDAMAAELYGGKKFKTEAGLL